jgi:hypothetical protein
MGTGDQRFRSAPARAQRNELDDEDEGSQAVRAPDVKPVATHGKEIVHLASVVPAKATTQCRLLESRWIPAFAGMTMEDVEAFRVGQGIASVVPAKAGTQCRPPESRWIPAFAGMTIVALEKLLMP